MRPAEQSPSGLSLALPTPPGPPGPNFNPAPPVQLAPVEQSIQTAVSSPTRSGALPNGVSPLIVNPEPTGGSHQPPQTQEEFARNLTMALEREKAMGQSNPYTATSSSHNQVQLPMENEPEEKVHSIITMCMAEFVGVIIFVYFGCLQAQAVGTSPNTNSTSGNSSYPNFTTTTTMIPTVDPNITSNSTIFYSSEAILHSAATHGFTLFVIVAMFGRISGAHINPVVTMAVAVVGKMSIVNAVCYWICQIAGSITAAFLVRATLDLDTFMEIKGGAVLIADAFEWYQGLTVEMVGSGVLTLAVLLTAVDSDMNMLAPLAIGLTLAVDILAIGNISGGSMNPARSFGPNVVAEIFMSSSLPHRFWAYHWVYYAGPFSGALIAAALYRAFFASDNPVIQ